MTTCQHHTYETSNNGISKRVNHANDSIYTTTSRIKPQNLAFDKAGLKIAKYRINMLTTIKFN
jgi:hypothetical protein